SPTFHPSLRDWGGNGGAKRTSWRPVGELSRERFASSLRDWGETFVARCLGGLAVLGEELLEAAGVFEGADHCQPERAVLDQVGRDALDVLGRDRVDPFQDLLRFRRPPFENLATQTERDQPVRALGLEGEPPLGEALRLVELV